MGQPFSQLMRKLFSSEEPSQVVILGLDGSGKTTLLYRLKLNETVATISTTGFNVETVTPIEGLELRMWDVGCRSRLIPLWKYYLNETSGIVYVVDSNDRERLPESCEVLVNLLKSPDANGIPVVVLANKQDLPNAMNYGEVISAFKSYGMGDREWHVQGTTATNGEGVPEAMEMLGIFIRNYKERLLTEESLDT